MAHRIARWKVEPLNRSRRGLDERVFMLAPVAARALLRLALSRPLGSRLRRAVLSRVARVGLAANNRDDYEAMSAFLHPDIELRLSPDDPARMGLDLDPAYHGIAGYLGVIETIKSGFDSHRWDIREMFDSGGSCIGASIEEVARGRGSGLEARLTMFHVWEFSGGVVARQQALTTEQGMLAVLDRSADAK